jgi:hypothetical protein
MEQPRRTDSHFSPYSARDYWAACKPTCPIPGHRKAVRHRFENAVTKHLKSLERAGLIERRKQGRDVFIPFRGEPLREVASWVHEYERFRNEHLDQFEQYFKEKKKRRQAMKSTKTIEMIFSLRNLRTPHERKISSGRSRQGIEIQLGRD